MAQKQRAENETPWWRTIPAMLTAAATFIGSVAALLALFVGPGGGDRGANGETRETLASTRATTEESSVPPNNERATEENVRKLRLMVPASMRSRCKQEAIYADNELARVSCELGGATFYYDLFADELDAEASFSVSVSNEEDSADGHAPSCGEIRTRRHFVGTWTRPGQARPTGQQLCTYDISFNAPIASIYWTETGRPIVGSMLYSGHNRENSVEGAQRVWNRVVR